jgi:hypothetical protein
LDALTTVAAGVAPFLIGEARKFEGVEAGLGALYFRKPEPDRVVQTDDEAESPSRFFEVTRLSQRGAQKARSTSGDARPSNSPGASQLKRRPRRPIR